MARVIKIVITLVALIYIFYDLDFGELYHSLLKFDTFGVILTLFINFVAFSFVAFRWRFLSKNICSFKASFESTFICLGINNITPAKLGEVAKGFYLKQFYGYFLSKSMALMVIERVFDVLILGALILFISYYVEISNLPLIISLLVIAMLCLTLFLARPKIFLKIALKYTPKKAKEFLSNAIKTVARIELKEWIFITIYTSLVWFLYYLSLWVFTKFGSTFELDSFQILVVFIFVSIGMALPSTPGGVGVFEAGAIFGLSLYGIDKEIALSFGFIFHMLQYIPTTLVGIFIINRKDFNFRRGFEN